MGMALVLRGSSAVLWHASKSEFPYFQGMLSIATLPAITHAAATAAPCLHTWWHGRRDVFPICHLRSACLFCK